MLERDEATEVLGPLALPTMAAFGQAKILYSKVQEAILQDRPGMEPPSLGMWDGVSYWLFFSSTLTTAFEPVDGVARLPSHPLAHHWSVGKKVVLQLKSDTSNLPLDQLVLPGMREIRGDAEELIVLTWDHDHVDRFNPAFVQLDGKREAWRVPVASLLPEVAFAIKPTVPRAQLSSKRRASAGSDETAAQS